VLGVSGRIENLNTKRIPQRAGLGEVSSVAVVRDSAGRYFASCVVGTSA